MRAIWRYLKARFSGASNNDLDSVDSVDSVDIVEEAVMISINPATMTHEEQVAYAIQQSLQGSQAQQDQYQQDLDAAIANSLEENHAEINIGPIEPSENAKKLEDIEFPDELIPNNMCGIISYCIMTEPVCDPRFPQHIFEAAQIKIALQLKAQHPITRAPLNEQQLVTHHQLKTAIDKFVSDIVSIYGKATPTQLNHCVAYHKKTIQNILDITANPCEFFKKLFEGPKLLLWLKRDKELLDRVSAAKSLQVQTSEKKSPTIAI